MLRPEDCIPGTLVECIASFRLNGVEMPIIGRIYEIDSLAPCVDMHTGAEGSAVRLAGVSIHGTATCGPHTGTHAELLFNRRLFRLLPDERLSIFRQMLAPAPKQKERV